TVDALTDVFDDMKECTEDTCNGMSPENNPSAINKMCSEGTGKLCDGAGTCVECNVDGDCAANEICPAHACIPATCNDLVKDGDETDIDCGGACGPTCDTDEACLVNGDCVSQ